MNNLKQKNVIYGRDQKDVLPHAAGGQSVVLTQNSNITDARINNAAQQLINNDLYIENRIAHGMNYQYGPVRTDDDAVISALPNGSKRWGPTTDYTRPLQILRKVDKLLQSTISTCRSAPVTFIRQIGDAVFVAFGDRLMYDVGAGLQDCKAASGANVVATGCYTCAEGTFFVSDSAVYELEQSFDDDFNVSYSLAQINVGTISGLKSVAYDGKNGMIYVGGSNSLIKRGGYDKAARKAKLVADVKICIDDVYGGQYTSEQYYSDAQVNALQILDPTDQSVGYTKKRTNVLAATSKGLFRSDTKYMLDTVAYGSLDGLTCKGVAEFAGAIYVQASNGRLYRKTPADDDFSRYGAAIEFTSPAGIAVHSSGLYAACSTGVYRYPVLADDGPHGGFKEYPESGSQAVNAVAVASLFGDRLVFAAHGNVVDFYSVKEQVESFSVDSGWTVDQIVPQQRKNSPGVFDVYVLAHNGSSDKRLFSVYMQFASEASYDYTRVHGMEKVCGDCKVPEDGDGYYYGIGGAAVYAGDKFYYAEGDYVRNASTGASKLISDIYSKIYHMDYLSDDNSLALAYCGGLRVLDAGTLDQIGAMQFNQQAEIVAQSPGVIYFRSHENLYAVPVARNGSSVQFGQCVLVKSGVKDLAAVGENVYMIGTDNKIYTSTPYYTTDMSYTAAEQDEGEPAVSPMGFPVMPYMEGVNATQAIGISAGCAYAITYASDSGYDDQSYDLLTVNGMTTIAAFCKVGQLAFVATSDGSGKVIAYDLSDDQDFDLCDLATATQLHSSGAIAGVTRLVHAGTDMTYDMRVYAETTGGIKMYRPTYTDTAILTCPGLFSDFLMYSDKGVDEGALSSVVVGIADGKLSVNVAEENATWASAWKERTLVDVGDQTNRTPYALYFCGNSRVYVAYTAQKSSGYVDCIAAVPTDSLLSADVIDTTDYYEIGPIADANSHTVRFSGFSIPQESWGIDGEDIDVFAVYKKDSAGRNTLLTFQVNVDLAQPLSSSVISNTGFSNDPALVFFQPDCMQFGSEDTRFDYYMTLPSMEQGTMLVIRLCSYTSGANICQYVASYVIKDVDVGVKDVFVCNTPSDSPARVEFVVVDDGGKAYFITVDLRGEVSWSAKTPAAGGAVFTRVAKFGPGQLIGYNYSLVYDFQGRRSYSSSGGVRCVYVTDNVTSRDYMLTLKEDKKIYNKDVASGLSFSSVSVLGSNAGNKTLSKANGHLFVIDWANRKVAKEKQTGDGFDVFVSSFPTITGRVDGCICYVDMDYYLCVLCSTAAAGTSWVDVYKVDVVAQTVSKYATYGNASSGVNTSFISYAIGFEKFARVYIFRQVLPGRSYEWPIVADVANAGDFYYVDPQADQSLEFTSPAAATGSLAGTYKRFQKTDGISYAVQLTGSPLKTVTVKQLPEGNTVLTKNVGSTISDAWYSGGMCFAQKSDGIYYYYAKGDDWRLAGAGTYGLVVSASGKPSYFLKRVVRENGSRPANILNDLYVGTYILSHPLEADISKYTVSVAGIASSAKPVRLAGGRNYAGVVYSDIVAGQTIYSMGILWPMGDPGSSPAEGSGGSSGSASTYQVYAVNAQFAHFPDGQINIEQIVPLGDFMDEIVVYEGGYLHIAKVAEGKLITDQSGSSTIPVTQTMPWSDLGEAVAAGIVGSAKLGGVRYVAGATGLSSFQDATSGLAMKALSPAMRADGVQAKSFYEIGQNKFLVASDKGVYRYMHLDGAPVVSLMSPQTGYDVRQITSYNFDGTEDIYIMANAFDNYVLSSENARVWHKMFKPSSSGTFVAVCPHDSRNWYFGTTAALYKTQYSYTEVDDLKFFTENDLYELYSKLLTTDISSMGEEELSQHELSRQYETGHLSTLMYDINTNLLSVNFDGLQSSGWQTFSGSLNGTYQVSNDMVFEQYWGDQYDWDIMLSTENNFVSAEYAKFTYLCRRWMSGFTEIYIRVPTTNTYYINHVSSTPQCTVDSNSELTAQNVSNFGKDKMVFPHDPNLPGVYTKMTITLAGGAFDVTSLLGVQACGNSLPLKIYKETNQDNGGYDDFQAAQYFNSYVAPTVMLSATLNEYDEREYHFACFGADEQVVRMEFMDMENTPNSPYYRLVFDPNGISMEQRTYVKQRIHADGRRHKLRRNQYTWPNDQRLFSGWTFKKVAFGQDVPAGITLFSDCYEIKDSEIEAQYSIATGKIARYGQDITVYAVWITHNFTADDTTLLMYPPSGKTNFKLGGVSTFVNPNEPALGERVVAKYEEVD